MDISVIIPSYKPQEYLWECLNTLSEQTLSKDRYEVILILNGCNEPYKSNIQYWICDHPDINLKLVQTDESGVSNARNIGLALASGDYVTFVDDDDYVSKEYLYELLLLAEPDAIVLTDSRAFIDGCVGFKESYTPHDTYIKCHKCNDQNIVHARAIFNGPCMKLIPMSFIQGNFDTSISVGEDALFMFLISYRVKKLKYARPSAKYFRRYRHSSATTTVKPKFFWLKNAFRLNNKYIAIWLKKPFSYNFILFCNRLMANIKGLVWHLRSEYLLN